MTDRRRNLFILLVVLGLIAASVAVVASKPTKLGLDLQGGVQLTYQGKPTRQQALTQESLQRAVDIMRERVDQLGVSEPEIARFGRDQIEVSLPGEENTDRAERQVGNTAQMSFYDWEPNVLNDECEAEPDLVDGGQQAITGFYNAVKRASECPAKPGEDNTNASDTRFYAFDKANKPLNEGIPEASEEDLFESLSRPGPNGTKIEGRQEGDQVIKVNEGILIVRDEKPTADAPDPDRWWIIEDNPVLAGTDIKNPEQNFDQRTNEPIVTMEFTDRGKRAFRDTTAAIAERGRENAGINLGDPVSTSHHFAIVLDNDLVSKPYINWRENPEGIDGETGAQISGGFDITSAQDLSTFLKIGALPIELELISRSQVSASLGKQALNQGLTAGIAGFIIVALFLLALYRVMGVIAVIALGVYSLYFFALIKLIPITLTLPGIAGLILTLGVAADANIVIFERVKEEIRAGRSIAAGIAQGYKKGFATIIDANVVTLLVAFILFILATAGVKGFAFTLGIGTIVSLFTAVLATQAILLSMRGTRVLQSRAALGAGETKRRWSMDFIGLSRWFFSMSGVILLIGALAIALNGLTFGIDFESGTRIKTPLERSVTVEQVRGVMEENGFADAEIQTVNDPDLGPNVVQIATETLQPAQVTEVREALDAEFGLDPANFTQESIGPTFGQSVANSALIAIIASLAVISIYIALRFEWKYAVPVLIAVMHDILITAGVYSLAGREVTASTVAALLTILGFSLYDTIIVFDRIRENVPRMPSAAFSQIVNRSMAEVLTRSLATSFCTGLPVLALYFFGGETLKDFAFALIVGIVSGTYSSVFIASPVLSHWKQRERVYRQREGRIRAELGHVPAYAVALAGAPVDVAPKESRRATASITAPQDPSQGVSATEFDEMVKNLGIDSPAERAGVAPARRVTGGRRARAKDGDGKPGTGGGGEGVNLEKSKKPRNRKHGRSR